jgi:hypothetical protein
MNPRIAALLAALPLGASALETPPAFPVAKIEAPPLTLVENALQGLPSFLNGFRIEVQRPAGGSRLYSRMPILVPGGGADARMVKAPDPAVDYKLTVRNPLGDPPR